MMLQCAALAAVQALLNAALLPIAVPLAAASPPAYALIAGIYSLMPFTARILVNSTGAATLTSVLAGFVTATFSPLGLIALIPFLLAGATIDAVLWSPRNSRRQPPRIVPRLLAAGTVSAVSLFLVSLPVFSSEHLTPLMLALTLGGRIAGQLIAALGALAVVRGLTRAGIHRPAHR